MKPLDENGDDIVDDDDIDDDDEDEYVLENELEGYIVDYRCDNCDYRWREIKKPYLSDEDRTGTRVVIDDSAVVCPMCGSRQITRVKLG